MKALFSAARRSRSSFEGRTGIHQHRQLVWHMVSLTYSNFPFLVQGHYMISFIRVNGREGEMTYTTFGGFFFFSTSGFFFGAGGVLMTI